MEGEERDDEMARPLCQFSSCAHYLCVQLTSLVLSSDWNTLITSMPALLMSVLVIACH